MEKLRVEVTSYQSQYLSQIEDIYQQNVISRGGMFHDKSLLPQIEKIAEELNSKSFYVLLLKDDKVLGVAQVLDKYVPGSLYVSLLAVHKDYQRMGVASTLLEYISKHTKDFKGVTLECLKKNEVAKSLYEKLGFIEMLSFETNDIQLGDVEIVYFYLPTFLDKNKQTLDYTTIEKQAEKEQPKQSEKVEKENHLE